MPHFMFLRQRLMFLRQRHRPSLPTCLFATLLLVAGGNAFAARCVDDDAGRRVCLEQPAERIVALSPGATELLFNAGAGERLVGAVSFSDFPPAAKALPRVGSYKRLDMEAVLALKPDLVVAWISGNPETQVQRLEELGLTVYRSEPLRFATWPTPWSVFPCWPAPNGPAAPPPTIFATASPPCATVTPTPIRCRCSTRSGKSR